MVARMVKKMLAPLKRKIQLMVSRCTIDLVNDSLKEQGLQITLFSGEERQVERYQEYGFTSVPQRKCEGVAVFVNGDRDHGIVIATGDRRYRLKGMAAGEVALYDDQGQKIQLKRGKDIEISGCDKLTANVAAQAIITCPDIQVVGAATISETLTVLGALLSQTSVADPNGTLQQLREIVEQMKVIYNQHTHPDGGVPNPQM